MARRRPKGRPEIARIYLVAREWAELDQKELAEKLGVDVQTIKRREAGTHGPRPGEREKVARICGVPEWFMLGGWDARELTLEQLSRLADERDVPPADEPPEDQTGHQGEDPGP